MRQRPCFHSITASFSLLALFLEHALFVFKHLQPLLPKQGGWVSPTRSYQRARMRYLRTEVPFLSTGTLNWAAKAAVLVNL